MWAQLQEAQPQVHMLTRAGNHPASAIAPCLASKPHAWGEGEREKEKAARKVGRSKDGEKGAAEPRQESQKFSLHAVARDD